MSGPQISTESNAMIEAGNHPRYLLQLVLARGSGGGYATVDITVWTWADARNPEHGCVMFSLCPACWAPVLGKVCTACHEMYEGQEDTWQGLFVRGSMNYVGGKVAEMFQKLGMDADLILMYLPESIAKNERDIARWSRKPLDEMLAQGEYRLYTKDRLSADTIAGRPIGECIREFVNA